MIGIGSHPKDFSPYLDRDFSDPRYEEIRLHLNACSLCRSEIDEWQDFEASLRSEEFEIDVPPFQWQRIAAQLAGQPGKIRVWERWFEVWSPHRLAMNLAFAFVLILAVTFFGLGYRSYSNGQQLVALASYSQHEQTRLSTSENPFSSLAGRPAAENPFAQFQKPEKDNPFALR